MLAVPVVLLLFMAPNPQGSESQLADFSRFTKAIGAEIAIVDHEGVVREGVVTAASANDVTMRFSGATRTFSRDAIASGERLRDGKRDGAIKGAIFGALVGLLVVPSYNAGGDGASQARGVATAVAVYSGIGWLIDAAQNHREAIYRSPAAVPSVKLTLRF